MIFFFNITLMQRLFRESVSLVIWKWLQFTECHMQSERGAF